MITVEEAIRLAKTHMNNGAVMQSSARFCVQEADLRLAEGHPCYAMMWATRSLMYSVGVFHDDCARVSEAMRSGSYLLPAALSCTAKALPLNTSQR